MMPLFTADVSLYRTRRGWSRRVINTDKNPAYGEAIAELKQEGTTPAELEHCQAK